MHKSLIALAVLGTLAGSCAAQSSITIYGVADAGIVVESGGPAGRLTKETGGGETPSRLGFRGKEDLGDGLSANFVLEMGYNMDTGTSAQGGVLFGRQAWLGINGGFGSVSLGRQYLPFFLTLVEVDPFLIGLAGNALNMMATGGVRINNSIKYATPNVAGLTGEVLYGLGEQAGDTKAGSQYSASVAYENGPLLVKLGYNNTWNLATGTVPATNAKNTLLISKYNFGFATGYIGYGINKSELNTNAQNSNSRDAIIGARVPFGVSTVIVSYIRKQDKSSNNLSANQWALGYTYALSKSTDLYTSVARIHNKAPNTAKAGFYTVGNGADPGTGDRAFNLGVRHLF